MAEHIQAALSSVSTVETLAPELQRLVVELPPIDSLAWLQVQAATDRMYWSDREGVFETAGIGVADLIEPSHHDSDNTPWPSRSNHDPAEGGSMRYFGGHRFCNRSGNADQLWSDFATCRFVLPRFELYRADERCWFVCNLRLQADHEHCAEILNALSVVVFPDAQQPSDLSPMIDRTDLPDRAGWESTVHHVLRAVKDGSLSKVVLARRSDLLFERTVDPVRLLRRLKDRSVDCFHFLFQFDSPAAFVGASPERLFRRSGRRIESEAVAGTRPRGATADEDLQMEQELINSRKDIIEHRFVVEDISRVMTHLCSEWQTLDHDDTDSLMKLARVQHLITRLEGQLDNGRSDMDIASMLHPTSAVGGVPTENALRMIDELEPFDRGWYAAPVGWLSRDSAEFAVAIRSGLVAGRAVHLYSGAGIVDGSSAEDEWREIDSKLANFLAALG